MSIVRGRRRAIILCMLPSYGRMSFVFDSGNGQVDFFLVQRGVDNIILDCVYAVDCGRRVASVG